MNLVSPLPAGAVRLSRVSKQFTKYQDTPTLAYGLLHMFGRSRRSRLIAVRDLDLEIQPGEAIGVLGRNGSGKSTLLQMICGVTEPTRGQVHVAGRVAPLISVGIGFHPELTGRENIYVNATILGLPRQEITRRLDEIIAFSEIEEFIDSPVKFYSSGMFVRLGFSVAAHVDPDVLLIDEVLAVGDISFQIKCLEHIRGLRERGTTLVMVSHNTTALEAHCDRGIVLSHGSKVFDGAIGEAVDSYYQVIASNAPDREAPGGEVAHESGALELLSVTLHDDQGIDKTRFVGGERLRVRFAVRARRPINAPFITVSLLNDQGIVVAREQNLFDPYPALSAGETVSWEFSCDLRVATGVYTLAYNVCRANQSTRQFERLADDVAVLVPLDRKPLYVDGRKGALGVVDVVPEFRVFDAASHA